MTSNNGDLLISRIALLDLGNESRGSDNIEGGDTEESLWVVDTSFLENLSSDWDGRVDLVTLSALRIAKVDIRTYRVGDDQDVGVWCRLSDSLSEVSDDAGVGVEKIYHVNIALFQEDNCAHRHGSCLAFVAHQLG